MIGKTKKKNEQKLGIVCDQKFLIFFRDSSRKWIGGAATFGRSMLIVGEFLCVKLYKN